MKFTKSFWVATGRDGIQSLYKYRPARDDTGGYWESAGPMISLEWAGGDWIKDQTNKDEPVKIQVTVETIDDSDDKKTNELSTEDLFRMYLMMQMTNQQK